MNCKKCKHVQQRLYHEIILCFSHCSSSTSSKHSSIHSACSTSLNTYSIPEHNGGVSPAPAAGGGATNKITFKTECLYDYIAEGDEPENKPKVQISEYATIEKPKSSDVLAVAPPPSPPQPRVLKYTSKDYAVVNKPSCKKKVEDQPSSTEAKDEKPTVIGPDSKTS